MHVDDVSADGNVHGEWNPESMRGNRKTERRMRRILTREVCTDRLAQTLPCLVTATDHVVQDASGLFSHAEPARAQRFVNVLGRRAGKRDLVIVDDPRAV